MPPRSEIAAAWREYEALVGRVRRMQVEQVAGAVQGVERLLVERASRLRYEIRRIPRGIEGDRYKRDLLASIEGELEAFRAQYQELLNKGITDAARLIERRETEAIDILLRARHAMSPQDAQRVLDGATQAQVAARFGNVASQTLERAYLRLYQTRLPGVRDRGLGALYRTKTDKTLSGILEEMSKGGAEKIRQGVLSAIADGKGPMALAKVVNEELIREGVEDTRTRAETIARTEINSAYREAHIACTTGPKGALLSHVQAIGWRLSLAHRRPDVCDSWASQDTDGLGPGNYLPANVPTDHPRGFCYTVSILVGLPDRQFAGTVKPRPELVPKAQLRYYGMEG